MIKNSFTSAHKHTHTHRHMYGMWEASPSRQKDWITSYPDFTRIFTCLCPSRMNLFVLFFFTFPWIVLPTCLVSQNAHTTAKHLVSKSRPFYLPMAPWGLNLFFCWFDWIIFLCFSCSQWEFIFSGDRIWGIAVINGLSPIYLSRNPKPLSSTTKPPF